MEMNTDRSTDRGDVDSRVPIMDSDLSPIPTIRDWLDHCDNNHAETCSPLVSASDPQHNTSWLIDVVNRCIVPGTTSNDYLALSYTWEHATELNNEGSELHLLSANTHLLTKLNGLDQYLSRIPKVIKDAMLLTFALKKQYLWVDRLCIVQDDPGKVTEFQSMDRVYTGAYMTIVAAAKYGIFDTPEETVGGMGRDKPWHMCDRWKNAPPPHTLSEKAQARYIERHYDGLSSTRWAHRGWTYQEYVLSRRVIFFTGSDLFWQCVCSVWDLCNLRLTENNEIPYKHSSGLGEIRQLSVSPWPDTSLYIDLACAYNGRDLTQQSDGLFAFLGILNRLAPAFPQGFLFGLPRHCFDYALVWQPLKNYRKSYRVPKEMVPPVRRPSLPSWAWCGWQCFIDPTSFDAAIGLSHKDYDKGTSWKLRNPVTWEYLDSVEQLKSQHISAYVTHAVLSPAATLVIQEYHAPVAHPPRAHPSRKKTRRPLVPYVELILNQKPLNYLSKLVVLQDTGGNLAGMVRVTGDSTCEPGQKMELIAISEGSADGRYLKSCFEDKILRRSIYADPRPFHPEYDSQQRWVDIKEGPSWKTHYQVVTEGEFVPRLNLPEYENDNIYHFYNVLWVKRGNDDVAYRVGCGRVYKAAWEEIATETVRVTLG